MRGIKAALGKVLKIGDGRGNSRGNGNVNAVPGATGAVPAAVPAAPAAAAGTTANAGFSEIDFAAATDDTVFFADTPTGVNSLGLDIEANDVGESARGTRKIAS